MHIYWPEFLMLFTINMMNVLSPGACFAITVRNSTMYNRKIGLLTALGVASSSCIQKTYVLLGFGLFLAKNPMLFQTVKYVGCAHLIYLAFCCFKNAKKKPKIIFKEQKAHTALSSWGAFRSGFLTDSLNPQASLGFMSIVVATVSPSTPVTIQAYYAIPLVLTATLWYTTVAFFFSNKYLRQWFNHVQHWFERIMGSLLIGLSFRLAMLTAK
jgi:threonine/homoserine/homoserine lactone efflux protein